jgi:type I restriction enzyme S subunit
MNGQGGTSLRRFKAYPAYKDSGVEWLGKIPAHWEVKRLWHLTPSDRRIMYGIVLPGPNVEDGVPIVKGGDVSPERLRLERLNRTTFEIESGYMRSRLRGGDLVYSIRGSIGEVAIIPGELEGANITQDAARIAYTSVTHGPWLLHALKSASVFAQLEAGALGATISGVNIRDLKRASIPVPPRAEQGGIASFLERETARIDALVTKKERLSDLLQEKRTALIARAVTKGLDPTVPTKDSGVEWLGEIPAHWEVKRLKAISGLQTGLTLGKKFEGRSLVARPYLRVANVQDGYLDLDDIADVELPGQDSARYELRAGDVLMTEGGDFDKLGRGHVWEGQVAGCLHQNHIFAVRPRRHVLSPYFLAHALSSGYGRAYFTATSKQSTNLASTNSTKLGNLPVPLPGLAEQDSIVLSIGQGIKRADALIAKIRDAIDRLKELRTALISAAVTGQIDVRGHVA